MNECTYLIDTMGNTFTHVVKFVIYSEVAAYRDALEVLEVVVCPD